MLEIQANFQHYREKLGYGILKIRRKPRVGPRFSGKIHNLPEFRRNGALCPVLGWPPRTLESASMVTVPGARCTGKTFQLCSRVSSMFLSVCMYAVFFLIRVQTKVRSLFLDVQLLGRYWTFSPALPPKLNSPEMHLTLKKVLLQAWDALHSC